MANMMSGRDVLRKLDASVSDIRRRVSEAIATVESIDAREAEVRDGQVDGYRMFADIRLDVITQTEDIRDLDRLHKAASALLEKHSIYVRKGAETLDAAAQKIATLEHQRERLAEKHDRSIEDYELKVQSVDNALKTDERYLALANESEATAAVAARAHQKLAVARSELEEKGAPYKKDPLFSYLWTKRYRSPDYKAGPIIQMLDNWVARLCKYDKAYLNFERLTALPEWLAEHAEKQDQEAATSLNSLEAFEEAALEDLGANKLRDEANSYRASIQQIDIEIETAEVAHGEIADRQARALEMKEGPAQEARKILEDGLRRTSFADLRVLAAETIDLTDDRIIDDLVKLRTEEMSLELEANRLAELPGRLKRSLVDVEQLRRSFKAARFDSQYATFKSAILDDAIAGLLSGQISSENAFARLRRSLRRVQPRTEPGFGGSRRSSTIGLPSILGDVIWEVAKQGGRQTRQGRSISFPTPSRKPRRRSPRINIPRGGRSGRSGGGGRKKGGGFKTGGGF